MNRHTLVTLGKKAFEEKDYKRSKTFLAEAVDGGAAYPDVLHTLGLTCHFLGEISTAIGYFRKALEINPVYVEALLSLSITLNDLGKYREAREMFENAVRAVSQETKVIPDEIVKPRIVSLLREMGKVSLSINRYEDAVSNFRKALEIAPEYPDLKLELASALREKGDFSEAKKILLEVLEEKPDYIPALQHLGIIAFAEGDAGGARRFWEKARTADPKNKLTLLYLNSLVEK